MIALGAGYVFAGRYRIVRLLGSGGAGAVYEAEDLDTERRRAIKVLHALPSDQPAAWERLRHETRVGGRIGSPFVVDVFDAGVDPVTRLPYLVLELLRGEDLARRLARLGPRPPDEVVDQLRQVALGLDASHRAGIVHRDVKPANLFAVRDDAADGERSLRIKILDFGLAHAANDEATRAPGRWGTPAFMAPEQLAGGVASPASDRYALGMVAFQMLVGRPYWSAEDTRSGAPAHAAVTGGELPDTASARAAAVGRELPPAFDAWFARATARDPERRFATAEDAVTELAHALAQPAPRFGYGTLEHGHEPQPEPPAAATTLAASELPPLRRPWSRGRGLAFAAVAVAALWLGWRWIGVDRTDATAASASLAPAASGTWSASAPTPVDVQAREPASPVRTPAPAPRRHRRGSSGPAAHAATLPREHLYSRD